MDPKQLKELIERVLRKVNLYSDAAVDLLMLTAAQESACGKYIRQLGNGPALGIFQMEPACSSPYPWDPLGLQKCTTYPSEAR